MNTKKYNWILYLISVTIVITVAVQLYWNYNNYLDNKQRVQNEIQSSLDIAMDEYYSNLSKSNFWSVFRPDTLDLKKGLFYRLLPQQQDSIKGKLKISSIEIQTDTPDEYKNVPAILDSLVFKDSLISASFRSVSEADQLKVAPFKFAYGERQTDSLKVLKGIQSVVIALTNDRINFDVLDSIFQNQLLKKGIDTEHRLVLSERGSVIGTSHLKTDSLLFFVNSKSTYLRPNQELLAYYDDPSIAALKKSSTGILLSLLLLLMVILSLFYLLKTIKQQKELAEIKNDLISNITHEFKTPIATISTAIEAIENFNALNDKQKTQKYLSMSSVQLKKLHQMVEKLLETATLDSEQLLLKKEPVDVVDLVSRVAKKHELLSEKEIAYSSNLTSKLISIDLFHIENAITNLVDNALKYGGNAIELNVNSILNTIEISIADNGNGIEKNQQERIFDKFYRVPKGNRHDVKGFGIGLYYAKKIVEKHGGSIALHSVPGNTVFKISLPNE